jgi:hypothetical protein
LNISSIVHLVHEGVKDGVLVEGRRFEGFGERDFDAVFDASVRDGGAGDSGRPSVVLCVTDGQRLPRRIDFDSSEGGLYERVGLFQFSGKKYSRLQQLPDVEKMIVPIR